MLLGGIALGLTGGVPPRVQAATKQALLGLVEQAVTEGCPCGLPAGCCNCPSGGSTVGGPAGGRDVSRPARRRRRGPRPAGGRGRGDPGVPGHAAASGLPGRLTARQRERKARSVDARYTRQSRRRAAAPEVAGGGRLLGGLAAGDRAGVLWGAGGMPRGSCGRRPWPAPVAGGGSGSRRPGGRAHRRQRAGGSGRWRTSGAVQRAAGDD
jgi:hypothetical protein